MYEMLQFLGPDRSLALMLVIGSLAILTTLVLGCVAMSQSYYARKQRLSAELVQEMLAAGFDANQIEKSLESAGLYERSATKEFVRDLGASIKARAGVPA